MDIRLQTEVDLRTKLLQTARKSAARKTALKQLEKAYKIANQQIQLDYSLRQNLLQQHKTIQSQLQGENNILKRDIEVLTNGFQALMKQYDLLSVKCEELEKKNLPWWKR